MDEKNVPWWRRALSFALGGIRSGFGLFSRAQNHKDAEPAIETVVLPAVPGPAVIEAPVIVAQQAEEPRENADWSEFSVGAAPVAEAAEEAEAVDVEPVEVDPAEVAAEEVLVVEVEPVEVAAEEVTAEPVAAKVAVTEISHPEIVEELTASAAHEVPAIELAAATENEPEPEAVIESEAVIEPEAVIESGATVDAPFEELTEPETRAAPVEPEMQPVPETEAVEAHADAEEMPAEAAQEEAEEEGPTQIEENEIPEPAELLASAEIAAEPETEIPSSESSAPIESVPDALPESIEDSEPRSEEQESELETTIEESETLAVTPETADEEVGAAAQTEDVPEALTHAEAEEAGSAIDAVPELSGSPVELNEPVAEEMATEASEPVAANEADASDVEEDEAEPEAEVGAEPEIVTEEFSEPATAAPDLDEPQDLTERMDLNQTNTGQMAEPVEPGEEAGADAGAAASEVAPDTEAAAEAPVAVAAPIAETSPAELAPAPAAQAPQKHFIKLESRDNEADLSPFSVVVSEVYDGPLDLLLDLIRKQDIDIYDIPIARITAQFLAYVNQLKASDVDVAGEFIYTASLLIHIKSKMLLPRAPTGPDDAAEDPRRELVERLLEHERFKNAAQMLQQKQMLEAASWSNPGMREFKDDEAVEPEIAADTVDLVRVFRDILERARNRPVINVEEDSVTVGQMIQFLSRRLTMEDKPIALRRLLSQTKSERSLIAMFLALLELVRLQAILLRQDKAFSEIFIKKHVGFEGAMNEGLANARDDWR